MFIKSVRSPIFRLSSLVTLVETITTDFCTITKNGLNVKLTCHILYFLELAGDGNAIPEPGTVD